MEGSASLIIPLLNTNCRNYASGNGRQNVASLAQASGVVSGIIKGGLGLAVHNRSTPMKTLRIIIGLMLLALAVILGGCNLTSEPEQPIELTALPTSSPTPQQQGTPGATSAVTALPLFTQVVPPTSIGFLQPTSFPIIPTATPSTISIVILSPIPGNVIAQNVQILGSAIHPNFLQYVVEYGPDPNPSNLWYPIGGARTAPVLNGVLGIWTTNTIPDGIYQLRLRVYLRDGSTPQTVVNNLRVQNAAPTPIPTNTPSIPRPIAAFTADRSSGESPLVVRFTNRSTGQISNYNWSFGDGSSSAEQNPTHVFRGAGEYEVRLTVSGPGGQSNVSQVIDVFVNPPTASFEYSPTSGTAPLTVRFTDRSTGQINDYLWDFGDGTRSNERNPSHTYATQGIYNVFLRVRGPGGANRAFAVVNVVNPQIPAPVANFAPDNVSGQAPLSIQFTSSSTGQITGYLWDFGDGATSTDANPIHRFEQPGSYAVRLTVNGPGGSSTKQGQVVVSHAPQAPIAAFTPSVTSGDAPLNVLFDNQTTGDVVSYLWDFGDSTTSTDARPTHRYDTPGSYTVRLTAFGPNNLSSFAEAEISVTRPLEAPRAQFDVQPLSGEVPLTVQITNQSSGDGISYTWEFGDGGVSSTADAIFSHVYNSTGSFTIRLTVRGPGGPDSVATANILVVDATLPQPTNTTEILPTIEVTSTSTITPEPTATDSPTLTPEPTITDSPSATPYPAPTAGFIVSNVTDLTVTVQDLSVDAETWFWDFGDGVGFSSDRSPQPYTYAQAGTYTITLTVGNAGGGQNSSAQQVTVNAPFVPPTETPTEEPQPEPTAEPTEEPQPEPSIADETAVEPDIAALTNALNGIVTNGDGSQLVDVFAVIGDRTARPDYLLNPFGDGSFTLDGRGFEVEAVIQAYLNGDAGGQNPFARAGAAVQNDLPVNTALNGAGSCGDTPVNCELDATQASILIISLGYRDAVIGTPIDQFERDLDSLVSLVKSRGVIPVLLTPFPRAESGLVMRDYADAVVRVADDQDVPLVNVWRLFNTLPDSGLSGADPSVANAGADVLNNNTIERFGANARNFYVLKVLSEIRSRVLGQ
jgi:PKD repeat protein